MAIVQSEGTIVEAQSAFMAAGFSAGIRLYSDHFEDYAAIWRTQPNVRLVVAFLARNIAHLGVKAFRAVSENERQPIDRAHPLSKLLRRPNPFTTRHRFMDALVHDRKVYDNFFALKARNPATGQLSLFRVPPPMIQPIGDNWLYPDGWRLLGNRAQPEFPTEQVLHLRGYNPADGRLGASPIDTLRRMLAEEIAAGEWREQYWRGAARMSGVIERPLEAPEWKEPARARFRADWQGTWAGNSALAGATPVLEEGMVWKEASFSPKDSEYSAARRLAREEAAAMFHVSPVFVGILDHANFSNMTEQHKGLYQDTLGPDLDEYEEDFGLQLLPEFPDLDPDEVYFEFNLAEKLKGSFEEQATALQTATGAPWLLRNEARARLNLPPVDGGDQLVTPLNVLTGGQASPRDTAPPPGSASRRRSARKSVDDLPTAVQGWHAKHVEILTPFFNRQAESVMARLGSGWTVDEAWDAERWNGELGDDLRALSLTMAGDVGAAEAQRFGANYDPARAEAWLHENARIAAEHINETTRGALVASLHHGGTASRRKDAGEDDEELDGLPDPLAGAWAVFALAASSRTDQLATSRVTAVGNFARHDAAEQAGIPMKVWIVNSRNSRHPEMNGETVPLGESFSNGGQWPGDPALGAAETAGCSCSIDFTTEDA